MGIDYTRFFSSISLELRASDVRELLKLTEGKKIISFAGGLPDPRIFPKNELAEIARQVVEERGEQALQYSPTPGVGEFREELGRFLNSKGVKVGDEDALVVTTGSQEALYLAALALVEPGDTVFMEEPGYLAAINLFKALKADLVPVPVDDDGMDTDALEEKVKAAKREGRRLKLVYVNPTSNNPNGTTMPDDRRKHLLEIASKYDLLIIEDDPYSYFTFDDSIKFTHIKTLDGEGRVLYLGTFSKILVPGLRLGWVAGPEPVVAKIELVKQVVDLHSSTLSQYIALEAIRRGIVDRVISMAKSLYRRKRDLMLEALEIHMKGVASWTKPVGGFFIFLKVKGVDMRRLLFKAVERGVAYVPGDAFYITPGRGRNTARLSYSFVREDEIEEGIKMLSETIKEERPH